MVTESKRCKVQGIDVLCASQILRNAQVVYGECSKICHYCRRHGGSASRKRMMVVSAVIEFFVASGKLLEENAALAIACAMAIQIVSIGKELMRMAYHLELRQ